MVYDIFGRDIADERRPWLLATHRSLLLNADFIAVQKSDDKITLSILVVATLLFSIEPTDHVEISHTNGRWVARYISLLSSSISLASSISLFHWLSHTVCQLFCNNKFIVLLLPLDTACMYLFGWH